jgi:nitrogen regulatory protein PII
MKKIEATIRPSDLGHVKEQLADAGVRNVVALAASCLGEGQARRVYRGSTYVVDAVSCIQLSVVVTGEQLGGVVDILRPAAERGPVLDGAIVVMSVEQVLSRAGGTAERSKGLPDTQVTPQEGRYEKQGGASSIRTATAHGNARLASKSSTA